MREKFRLFWLGCKWLSAFLGFLGGVYLAGWGAHAAARLFVTSVSAESLGPRIEKVEQAAILNANHWDKRFNTLEVGIYGKIVTPTPAPIVNPGVAGAK